MVRLLSFSLVIFSTVTFALGNDDARIKIDSVKQAIHGLSSTDAKVRAESVEILTNRSEILWDENPCDSQDRAEILKFRRAAKPLVEHLILALKNDDLEVVSAAASSLAMLGVEGKAAIPTLREILKTIKHEGMKHQGEANWEIILALLHVTPKEKPVGPLFLEYAKMFTTEDSVNFDKLSIESKEKQVFSIMTGHAGIAYTSILARADRTTVEVPYLVKVTSKKYPLFVRVVAIDILGHLAWDAEPAIPTLQKLLREKNKFIQASSASALIRIQKRNANLTSILKELKVNHEKAESVRKFAEQIIKEDEGMLSFRGRDKSEWIFELVEIAKCSNGFYRRSAIIALGKIGADAKTAIPALTEILKECDQETRKRVVEALKTIDPEQIKEGK